MWKRNQRLTAHILIAAVVVCVFVSTGVRGQSPSVDNSHLDASTQVLALQATRAKLDRAKTEIGIRRAELDSIKSDIQSETQSVESARAAQPSNSLAGCSGSGTINSRTIYIEFGADGQTVTARTQGRVTTERPYTGSYSVNGNTVRFVLGPSTFTGTISGSNISGSRYRSDGISDTWDMNLTTVPSVTPVDDSQLRRLKSRYDEHTRLYNQLVSSYKTDLAAYVKDLDAYRHPKPSTGSSTGSVHIGFDDNAPRGGLPDTAKLDKHARQSGPPAPLDKNITGLPVHISGLGAGDNATAKQNLIDATAGRPLSRSSYGKAPGGQVYLNQTTQDAAYNLSQDFKFRVIEVAGGSHKGKGHYRGNAFDVDTVNGVRINKQSLDTPSIKEFRERAEALGARVIGPDNDPKGHPTHFHLEWPN